MKSRVRIFQPIVPEYRKALFDGLAERFGDSIEVWAANSLSAQDVSVPLGGMRYDYNHPLIRFGPFIWQRGLSLKGMRKDDVIVVCGDIHQLSSLWVAFVAKIRGISVVWWGHHKTATSGRLGVWLRLQFAKHLSDVMLVYTKTGIEYLLKRGFHRSRVFATGNTIDQKPIAAAMSYWLQGNRLEEFARVHDVIKDHFFVCCGVLRDKVKLDQFIRVFPDARFKGYKLVVIGDGPMKTLWQALAKEYGVADRIVWVHGTRSQEIIAPWFLLAKVMVYPGSIGLTMLHSLSYGLPVVTHSNKDHQMPEYEIMETGVTGATFLEGDERALVSVLDNVIKNSPGYTFDRKKLHNLAFNKYSMEQMIKNFCAAIEACGRKGGAMKILQVVPGMGESDGVAVFVRNLTRELRGRGHEVEVLMQTQRLEDSQIASYDVMHIHGLWNRFLHGAASSARRVGVPIVWSPHGMLTTWALRHKWFKKFLALILYQRSDLKKANLIHVTAEPEAEDVKRLIKCVPLLEVPLGVAINDKMAGVASAGKRVLLFLSRVQKKKGLPNLIRAWGLVPDEIRRNWVLKIAGPDQEGHTQELIKLARGLGVIDELQFLGPVYGDEKNALYREASLFVLPTHSENFGSVVVEALSFGLPVICTKGAPWRDLRDRNCGWWVDVGVAPLASALTEAMTMPLECLHMMGSSGIELVREKYTWGMVGEKFTSAYSSLLTMGCSHA